MIVVAILAIVVTPTALHLYQVTGGMRQDGCLGSVLALATLAVAYRLMTRRLT